MSYDTPNRLTTSPVNHTNGVSTGLNYALLIPCLRYVSKNKMSTEVPLSTSILLTSKLAITRGLTRGSSCGHFIPSKSFRENDRYGTRAVPPVLTAYMSLLASARLALLESPSLLQPPKLKFTIPVMLGGPSGDPDLSLSNRPFTLWVFYPPFLDLLSLPRITLESGKGTPPWKVGPRIRPVRHPDPILGTPPPRPFSFALRTPLFRLLDPDILVGSFIEFLQVLRLSLEE
ncbi:hypothetical protein LIER_09078 [Lithospermum erythrorhizon]|uniref:Uncharacterized protein n=1 Tax=Lithospermum erythrorhizon TaxID=34254 RepID=A0AAV3PFN2_LITER